MTAVTSHVDARGGAPRAFGLDVVRVLAALGVLVTHVAFATGVVNPQRWSSPLRHLLPRLDVGVSIFFVLSGLLVTRPFIRRFLAGAHQGPVGLYARRRLSRIYPLYWVILAVVLLTATSVRPSWPQIVADVLLVHPYNPSWAIGPITQSWSLATELAFYAFVPLWFWLCRAWCDYRRVEDTGRRTRFLVAGLIGWVLVAMAWRVGVVVLTDRYVLGTPGAVDTRGALLTWLPNHLDTFAVGAAMALWLESGRAVALGLWTRIGCYLVAAAALWTASNALGLPPVYTGFDGPQTLGRHALFVLCAAVLVLPSAAVLGARRDVGRSHAGVSGTAGTAGAADAGGRTPEWAMRVATAAAFASYGIYLWHQWVTDQWFERRGLPDFQAAFLPAVVVVAVGSTVLAAITYWSVERPSSSLALGSPFPGPAAAAAAEPRQLGRQRHLDGLRGLAVLAVLATHVVFLDSGNERFALRGGFLGVDVFLALSGFLIGAVLLRELDGTGTIDGLSFGRRRLRRLYPPLVVFLAIQGVVAVVWIGTSFGEEIVQAVLALTFTSNWQLSFGHQPPFALVHIWSLSLEGQFYVLMAVGIWALRRRLRRPDLVVAGLVLGSVAVALWRMYLYRVGVSLPALYERTGARADSMLLGVAAAIVWRSGIVSDRRIRVAGAVGLAFLAVAAVIAAPGAEWLFRGGFTLIAAASAAAVAAAATGTGAVAAIGGVKALRWVGTISYSLYLWHLPIYLWVVHAAPDAPVVLKVVVAVSASFLAAWLSFRLVESRVLAPWRRTVDGHADA